MDKILDVISDIMGEAFKNAGYDTEYGHVSVSNRPDLCDYQCNGAMSAAKIYKERPIDIANKIADILKEKEMLESVEAVMPGFINIKINGTALSEYLNQMASAEKFGYELKGKVKTVIVDYGGANVAKPLHVGHLRPAVIGESIKRIFKYAGHNVIGDAHLGDWGLQMGEVISEIRRRNPSLPYFAPGFEGEYPDTAPFTISDLEEIYPTASARMKEDREFAKECHEATVKYQKGEKGYKELGRHIINVSKEDLKRNYEALDVHFELWKGESDADPYVDKMLSDMIEKGVVHESRGALVVDIAEPGDKKEYPPCIVRKSDGSAIYETTDLATLVEREEDYKPDVVIYVVDKRQELHFLQVFRAARKSGIVREETELKFIGNGTVNGKDNKPFKTRDGGTLRLASLIENVNNAVYERIMNSKAQDEKEALKNAKIIGLAALKYGDLSNQATKDYIFDIDKFCSFEGNTGPYILYTIVRIKSILGKYKEKFGSLTEKAKILKPETEAEKKLMLKISAFSEMTDNAMRDMAPHVVCRYIYELCDAFNGFYHDTKILTEESKEILESRIKLLSLTKGVLEDGIYMLGFSAPEKM